MRRLLDDPLAGEAAEGILDSDVRIDPGIAQRLRAPGYLR